jgi:hypothetical protein
MDMAQKYTLSRKIGQLPEETLPLVLKIVERLSPQNLLQVGTHPSFSPNSRVRLPLPPLTRFAPCAPHRTAL